MIDNSFGFELGSGINDGALASSFWEDIAVNIWSAGQPKGGNFNQSEPRDQKDQRDQPKASTPGFYYNEQSDRIDLMVKQALLTPDASPERERVLRDLADRFERGGTYAERLHAAKGLLELTKRADGQYPDVLVMRDVFVAEQGHFTKATPANQRNPARPSRWVVDHPAHHEIQPLTSATVLKFLSHSAETIEKEVVQLRNQPREHRDRQDLVQKLTLIYQTYDENSPEKLAAAKGLLDLTRAKDGSYPAVLGERTLFHPEQFHMIAARGGGTRKVVDKPSSVEHRPTTLDDVKHFLLRHGVDADKANGPLVVEPASPERARSRATDVQESPRRSDAVLDTTPGGERDRMVALCDFLVSIPQIRNGLSDKTIGEMQEELKQGRFGEASCQVYNRGIAFFESETRIAAWRIASRNGILPEGCPLVVPRDQRSGRAITEELLRAEILAGRLKTNLKPLRPGELPDLAGLNQTTTWLMAANTSLDEMYLRWNVKQVDDYVDSLGKHGQLDAWKSRDDMTLDQMRELQNARGEWFQVAMQVRNYAHTISYFSQATREAREVPFFLDHHELALFSDEALSDANFPGKVVRKDGKIVELILDLPKTLDRHDPENLAKMARLHAWLEKYGPPVDQATAEIAKASFDSGRMLMWGDVDAVPGPDGRDPIDPETNQRYNFVSHRFEAIPVFVKMPDGSMEQRIKVVSEIQKRHAGDLSAYKIVGDIRHIGAAQTSGAVRINGQLVPVDCGEEGITIGANGDVKVHGNNIDPQHARLRTAPDGRIFIKDNGSRDGVYIGDQRVDASKWVEVFPDQAVTLGKPAQTMAITRNEKGQFSFNGQEVKLGETYTMGTSGSIKVKGSNVSPEHLVVQVTSDGRILVKDNGSAAGTYLNGKVMDRNRWVEINSTDTVTFGPPPQKLEIQSDVRLYKPGDMVAVLMDGRMQLMPAENLIGWKDKSMFFHYSEKAVWAALDIGMIVSGTIELKGLQLLAAQAGKQALGKTTLATVRGLTHIGFGATGILRQPIENAGGRDFMHGRDALMMLEISGGVAKHGFNFLRNAGRKVFGLTKPLSDGSVLLAPKLPPALARLGAITDRTFLGMNVLLGADIVFHRLPTIVSSLKAQDVKRLYKDGMLLRGDRHVSPDAPSPMVPGMSYEDLLRRFASPKANEMITQSIKEAREMAHLPQDRAKDKDRYLEDLTSRYLDAKTEDEKRACAFGLLAFNAETHGYPRDILGTRWKSAGALPENVTSVEVKAFLDGCIPEFINFSLDSTGTGDARVALFDSYVAEMAGNEKAEAVLKRTRSLLMQPDNPEARQAELLKLMETYETAGDTNEKAAIALSLLFLGSDSRTGALPRLLAEKKYQVEVEVESTQYFQGEDGPVPYTVRKKVTEERVKQVKTDEVFDFLKGNMGAFSPATRHVAGDLLYRTNQPSLAGSSSLNDLGGVLLSVLEDKNASPQLKRRVLIDAAGIDLSEIMEIHRFDTERRAQAEAHPDLYGRDSAAMERSLLAIVEDPNSDKDLKAIACAILLANSEPNPDLRRTMLQEISQEAEATKDTAGAFYRNFFKRQSEVLTTLYGGQEFASLDAEQRSRLFRSASVLSRAGNWREFGIEDRQMAQAFVATFDPSTHFADNQLDEILKHFKNLDDGSKRNFESEILDLIGEPHGRDDSPRCAARMAVLRRLGEITGVIDADTTSDGGRKKFSDQVKEQLVQMLTPGTVQAIGAANEELRACAVTTLGQLAGHDQSVFNLMCRIAGASHETARGDKSPLVRSAALDVIGSINPPRLNELALLLLERETDPEVLRKIWLLETGSRRLDPNSDEYTRRFKQTCLQIVENGRKNYSEADVSNYLKRQYPALDWRTFEQGVYQTNQNYNSWQQDATRFAANTALSLFNAALMCTGNAPYDIEFKKQNISEQIEAGQIRFSQDLFKLGCQADEPSGSNERRALVFMVMTNGNCFNVKGSRDVVTWAATRISAICDTDNAAIKAEFAPLILLALATQDAMPPDARIELLAALMKLNPGAPGSPVSKEEAGAAILAGIMLLKERIPTDPSHPDYKLSHELWIAMLDGYSRFAGPEGSPVLEAIAGYEPNFEVQRHSETGRISAITYHDGTTRSVEYDENGEIRQVRIDTKNGAQQTLVRNGSTDEWYDGADPAKRVLFKGKMQFDNETCRFTMSFSTGEVESFTPEGACIQSKDGQVNKVVYADGSSREISADRHVYTDARGNKRTWLKDGTNIWYEDTDVSRLRPTGPLYFDADGNYWNLNSCGQKEMYRPNGSRVVFSGAEPILETPASFDRSAHPMPLVRQRAARILAQLEATNPDVQYQGPRPARPISVQEQYERALSRLRRNTQIPLTELDQPEWWRNNNYELLRAEYKVQADDLATRSAPGCFSEDDSKDRIAKNIAAIDAQRDGQWDALMRTAKSGDDSQASVNARRALAFIVLNNGLPLNEPVRPRFVREAANALIELYVHGGAGADFAEQIMTSALISNPSIAREIRESFAHAFARRLEQNSSVKGNASSKAAAAVFAATLELEVRTMPLFGEPGYRESLSFQSDLIGYLGGLNQDLARPVLDAVARNHPDAAIKSQAAKVLARLTSEPKKTALEGEADVTRNRQLTSDRLAHSMGSML